MAIDIRSRQPKRRFRMISFRVVFRSVWDHPFLVVMLLFLVYLYSCCPLLLSVLISASPYLVCTAVLLGTLLIHGQPNDYRRPSSREKSNTSTSLESEIGEHKSFVNGDGIFYKDRFSEVRNDIVEKGLKVSGVVGEENPLDHVSEDANFKYHNPDRNQSSKIDREKSKMGFPFTDFEDKDVQKCEVQAQNTTEIYEERAKENKHCRVDDQLDSSPDEHKRVGDSARHESDSESDGGEKSSLDALVADVIPTPQETHPLLDCDDPVLPELTNGGSPKSELHSSASSESSRDSEEETDSDDDDRDDHDDHKHGVLKSNGNDDDAKSAISWTDDDRQTLLDLKRSEEEKNEHLQSLIARVGDDREDEGDGEEDEEGHSDDEDDEDDLDMEKVGCEQHVTMWTEEDEKNLRDLGKVEQERNQRLENLLAKRRAQRNYSMIPERNLIDLDRCDLPFQVAPISTNRVNPFDVPHNAHTQPSMPSIPGSAPSVTLPRRNPFDSPCTSPKATQSTAIDTPNKGGSAEINGNTGFRGAGGSSSSGFSPFSVGDSSKHAFADISRKENIFRRYESFSTGYKYVGETSRQDFTDIDRRDAVFRRHETFNTRTPSPSMFSHEKGDAFRMRPVFVADQVAHRDLNHSSIERQSSQSSDSSVSSRSESEPSIVSVNEEDLFNEEVAVNEEALVNGEDVVNEDPGVGHEIILTSELHDDREEITIEDHGSSSSESESSEMVVSVQQGQDRHLEASTEMTTDEIYQETKETDDDHGFSSSSSSEEDDKYHNTHENENEKVGEPSSSLNNSSEVSDLNHTSPEEDHIHVEPVYDTSPGSEINKPLFFDAAEN